MDKQIKELALASMFLAMACALTMIQIPIFPSAWLNLDFSLVPILLSRRYIRVRSTYIITFIFPWFSLLSIFGSSGGLVGVAFLALQVWPLIILDVTLNKSGSNIKGILLIFVIIVIYSTLLNNWIMNPIYMGWNDYYSQIWANIALYAPTAFVFNCIKMIAIYSITVGLIPLLDKETYGGKKK